MPDDNVKYSQHLVAYSVNIFIQPVFLFFFILNKFNGL